MKHVALVVVLALSTTAFAEETVGQTWSVVGPRTLEVGGNGLEIGAGWPGLSVGYLRGVASGLNLGARVSFNYGLEGLVRSVVPGAKLQALVKFRFLDTERVSLGLTFEPGPIFYSGNPAMAGFAIPLGLRLGIAASSAFSLAVLVEVPLWVQFGSLGGVNVPILSGVGLEYFVTSNVALFFRTRLGPTIRPYQVAEFTFEGTLGVGLKL